MRRCVSLPKLTPSSAMSSDERTSLPGLTEREEEICRKVAELKSTSVIALELGISVRTVQAHIYSAARHLPGKGAPMKRIIRFFADT